VEASGHHARWPAPLAVVALGLLACSSAFPAAFVFDDGAHIPGNELLEDPAS
jgi:hypothetical protein